MREVDDATIAAIATGAGESAISVIRLSGASVLSVAAEVFPSLPRGEALVARHVYVAVARDPANDVPLDQCVVTFFAGPSSYTGEDMLEIGCHGGVIGPARVLSALCSAGCRPARPGEFSERAFLNGKLSLSQAEGVAAIIAAKSEAAQRNALRQVEGTLGAEVGQLADRLRGALVSLEASLDFEENEAPPVSPAQLGATLDECASTARALAETWEYGRLLQEGVRLVLAGRSNTGKSSLLNALLREKRAIVTDVPGTTRDTVEGMLTIDGLPVTLIDTAGITASADPVERLGVARAMASLAWADLAVWVVDGSEELTDDDHRCVERLRASAAKTVVALNKRDLASVTTAERVQELLGGAPPVVTTCALTGEGVEALRTALKSELSGDHCLTGVTSVVISVRHREALVRTANACDRALEGLEASLPAELVCLEVREALQAVGEITGETATDEIIAAIFEQFCIGK